MPRRPCNKRISNGRLRDHRLSRGWSQDDLANELIRLGYKTGEENLGVSQKMVSGWERGESKPRAPYPKLLVRLFGVPAEELGLHAPARLERYGTRGDDETERRTFLETMVGAAFLPRALAGLSLKDFIHEPRRYLTVWATTPTRGLVPPALGCLWLAEASGSDEAACEASLLLAWLAYDLGDDFRMSQHYREAAEYARRTGSGRLLTYTLISWANHTDDAPAALRLVEQAKAALPEDAPRALRGVVYGNESFAYAAVGDRSRTLDALDRMEPAEPEWPTVFPLDDLQIVRCRGEAAVGLGIPDVAIPALHQALETYGSVLTKRRARILLPLAEAYHQTGDHEQARRLAVEAEGLGHKLGLRLPRADRV